MSITYILIFALPVLMGIVLVCSFMSSTNKALERKERISRTLGADPLLKSEIDRIDQPVLILRIGVRGATEFRGKLTVADVEKSAELFEGISEKQKEQLKPAIKELATYYLNLIDNISTLEKTAIHQEISALDKMIEDIKAEISAMKKGTVANG